MTKEELAKLLHKKIQQIEVAQMSSSSEDVMDQMRDIWPWGEGPERYMEEAEQLAEVVLSAITKDEKKVRAMVRGALEPREICPYCKKPILPLHFVRYPVGGVGVLSHEGCAWRAEHK